VVLVTPRLIYLEECAGVLVLLHVEWIGLYIFFFFLDLPISLLRMDAVLETLVAFADPFGVTPLSFRMDGG
jgi:hypothetical protein